MGLCYGLRTLLPFYSNSEVFGNHELGRIGRFFLGVRVLAVKAKPRKEVRKRERKREKVKLGT